MPRNPLLRLSHFGDAGNAGTSELIARCPPGYFFLPSLSVLLIFLPNQAQIQSEADSRNKVGVQPRPYFLSQLNGVVSLILLLLLLIILIRLNFIGYRATRPHVYKQGSPPITQQNKRGATQQNTLLSSFFLFLSFSSGTHAPKSNRLLFKIELFAILRSSSPAPSFPSQPTTMPSSRSANCRHFMNPRFKFRICGISPIMGTTERVGDSRPQ